MNRNKSKVPKLLVIQGIREAALDYTNHITQFEITCIIYSQQPFTPSMVKVRSNVKLINLSYKSVFPFDPVSLWQKNINHLSWQYIENIEKYIKDTDIVLITDTYYFLNKQVALLAKKWGKPLVTVIWCTLPKHISAWLPPYSFNTKTVIRNTSFFILRSAKANRFLDTFSVEQKNRTVIYNGINLRHFYPAQLRKRPFVNILFVGNYHKSKGLLDLLSAFERLVKDGLPVKLLLAGSGNLKNIITKKKNILPIVDFGYVNYNNLPDIYRQADIFCSPSKDQYFFGIKTWEEYFSYTLMEAQASGLPIVTTDSGGINEEVKSENPILPQGGKESLYFALKTLTCDKAKRELLGAANRKRAEEVFSAEKQAKKTEEVLMNFYEYKRTY